MPYGVCHYAFCMYCNNINNQQTTKEENFNLRDILQCSSVFVVRLVVFWGQTKISWHFYIKRHMGTFSKA